MINNCQIIFSLFRIIKNTTLLKKYYSITLSKLFFNLPNKPQDTKLFFNLPNEPQDTKRVFKPGEMNPRPLKYFSKVITS
jgi:hypothetical protein